MFLIVRCLICFIRFLRNRCYQQSKPNVLFFTEFYEFLKIYQVFLPYLAAVPFHKIRKAFFLIGNRIAIDKTILPVFLGSILKYGSVIALIHSGQLIADIFLNSSGIPYGSYTTEIKVTRKS